MKKIITFLTLIIAVTLSYGQNDCSQGDGTFRYRATLNIPNVPNDFDKTAFIDFVQGLDNISSGDLNTLNEHITLVYKTFPSLNPNSNITIVATVEIDTILSSLINSIQFHYCVLNDCIQTDGSYRYNVLLTNNVPVDFDKDDFIAYITGLDTISNDDLNTLMENITSVEKAFPTSQSTFLQRVVTIEATVEIYSILATLVNSIEFYECYDDGIVLAIGDSLETKKAVVYPNPITETSLLQLGMKSAAVRIELINALGQIVHNEAFQGEHSIELKKLPITQGISFLKIYDLTNGYVETLKIIKN